MLKVLHAHWGEVHTKTEASLTAASRSTWYLPAVASTSVNCFIESSLRARSGEISNRRALPMACGWCAGGRGAPELLMLAPFGLEVFGMLRAESCNLALEVLIAGLHVMHPSYRVVPLLVASTFSTTEW